MGSGSPPIFVAEHFLKNTWTYVRLWWGAKKQKREKCGNSERNVLDKLSVIHANSQKTGSDVLQIMASS